MNKKKIIEYLSDPDIKIELFRAADEVRKKCCGDVVRLRGIIEFSNNCVRNCLYCGLRRDNKKIKRYRMSEIEILDAVKEVTKNSVRTVVLQSGDDPIYTTKMICALIRKIKKSFPCAITLSIGERPLSDYRSFKDEGADRYLLKHETANPDLYRKLHPGQDFKTRIKILEHLKKLKYEVGAGSIVGLPGQTIDDMAEDIVFLKKLKVDMAGIGPFIPQKDTPFGRYPAGSLNITLRMIALLRIALGKINLPATTALATTDPAAAQIKALKCGANVIMCDFTPNRFRKEYRIYDNKERIDLPRALGVIKKSDRKAR